MKIKTEQVVDVQEWDKLVEETYKRKYSFQQQNGCQDRGNFYLTVPSDETEDFENDTVPEKVNQKKMGVSFKAWLERDPKQVLKHEEGDSKEQWLIDLWWERNFYPDIQMVANDLHKKGLLRAGDYTIYISW